MVKLLELEMVETFSGSKFTPGPFQIIPLSVYDVGVCFSLCPSSLRNDKHTHSELSNEDSSDGEQYIGGSIRQNECPSYTKSNNT